MKSKIIYFFIFILIVIFSPNIYSQQYSYIPEITSSTFFVQDFTNSDADVEVITSEDIKNLGINNIPDLLSLIGGVNIYHINESTANFSLRGYPVDFRIAPLILIDGMEISENFYERTYLYNLPVEISDIDRIEIIKNTSFTLNGYPNVAGIINIVTRPPEFLDQNYLYEEIGSRFYRKTYFSINKYLLNTYFKLNGFYRRRDQNDIGCKTKNTYFLNSDIVKYFNKSRIDLKFSFMNENLNFYELVTVGVFHKPTILAMHNNLNNLKVLNFLFNFKRKDFDFSVYFNENYGDFNYNLESGEKSIFLRDRLVKISIRKKINIKKNEIISGVESKFKYGYLSTFDSIRRESLNFFIQDNFNFYKNFYFNFYFNSDFTKNLGNKISYKLNLIYKNKKHNLKIRLGYSREFKKPFMLTQYLNLGQNISKERLPLLEQFGLDDIRVVLLKNKNLSSYQIKSSEISITKSFNNLNFNFTYFYNLLYDIPNMVGNVNFFPPEVDLKAINLFDFCTYGFDTKLEYNFNRHKFFVSYYNQNIKNKTFNKKKDAFVPKYKLSSGVILDFKKIISSINVQYLPSIQKCYGRTDNYLTVNSSINFSFFNNRIKTTIYGYNIFNKRHKEDLHGDKLERTIYLKLRYDF